jgi:hypothetical protein
MLETGPNAHWQNCVGDYLADAKFGSLIERKRRVAFD